MMALQVSDGANNIITVNPTRGATGQNFALQIAGQNVFATADKLVIEKGSATQTGGFSLAKASPTAKFFIFK